jgi:hypothetical protein
MITRTKWTEIQDDETETLALQQAKGSYQFDLILGYENLSGSTLRGKAARYGAKYAESRFNLIRRLREAGFHVTERRAEKNARILVIERSVCR